MNSDLRSASFHLCPDSYPESLLQTGMGLEGLEATLLYCWQLGGRLARERCVWGGRGESKKGISQNLIPLSGKS